MSNSTMTRPTLYQSQTNALFTLLNLNQPIPSSSTTPSFPGAAGAPSFEDANQGPLVWKVLILDDASKDILATSLRVQDLREQGVTLHMYARLSFRALNVAESGPQDRRPF